MKKVFLSLVVVALFGSLVLSSCKSGSGEAADTTAAPVEEVAPAMVDTAVVDTTVADTTVAE
ncbi:MAG: hypothetical protein HC905_27140 [Bacteroidales bacterium]|nr:hypothetical protein [Bacteroidales bacterium]